MIQVVKNQYFIVDKWVLFDLVFILFIRILKIKQMNKDELITKADLEQLKSEIKDIIISLIDDKLSKNKWLKSNDVQKMLGVSYSTLKSLRIKGVLPHSKIGGSIYYNYSDIINVLEENKISVF